MNKLQEKRNKLLEYARILQEYNKVELADACMILIEMAYNACHLSPEFEQLINTQFDIQSREQIAEYDNQYF